MSQEITNIELSTPSGTLSLLTSPPSEQVNTAEKPPLLLLHGANCSASCYKNLISFFSSHSYPVYALSLRGHGASWQPYYITMMLFTTLDCFAADVLAARDYITDRHTLPPVLVGHSFGGGLAQYLLSTGRMVASGLVLLGAAPLTGGGREIMANWQQVEAPEGYKWPWSPRTQLETPEQVRKVFFSEGVNEEAIETWLRECKCNESARAGLSVLWPFGTADKVLGAIEGVGKEGRKKVFCLAGERDVLVTPEMVTQNAKAYKEAVGDGVESWVSEGVVQGSGHHLMLDATWRDCAEQILRWLED